MRRGFWFVAGAGAGVYVMVRARRAAETFTPDGFRDRIAGLGVGAHLFADEVRAGMTERETELRQRLGLALDGPLELASPEPHAPLARTSTTESMEGTH
ncbi:DUF6167 family protein [Nocardioides pocheonensis]|uniref:Uncharacterized protein n=1 Tax=Nocardioides pocheonensis TaxID=661485 RepID=A0A3N0GEU9_9ACTN|nr:DUF6167 family protein [Nocardioides pocheonensis]RNM11005.1 hypothetical protein EFL26_22840 [Nocardioides pocheonensis]